MSGFMHDTTALKEVSKTELLKDSGASAELLKALCQRSVLECYEKDKEPAVLKPTCNHAVLNEQQQKAIDAIRKIFENQQVCLLHGYTSSGKTEIYIHLIEECINSGKQALMLVPEIALTTQLSDRLRRVFGDKLGVYHSGLSDYERMCVWSQLTEGNGFQVILGARSSVFLPFRSLGLIVVDEEHETSYKQQDPAPRYNGRNAALVLAAQFGAKTLLGTATPSVESYANCLMGKSGLVELFTRHKEMPLPEIIAVNTRELKRKKRMKSIFSPLLEEKINDALKAGEQVILFQNRRGYSPLLECNVCGWVPRCKHCDVSLTYHKNRRKLCCHYCGFEQEIPSVCPCCGESNPTTHGFGTEQVEEETLRLFPDARIVRMDTDTTRNKHSFEKILHDFESGKTNIMIGTQMVSKGLDFSNVRVVGILNADMMLNLPDFRAYERAYQLMAQVSGRAGRSGQRGQVIIQTSKEDNQIIGHVISNDYKAFFNEEVLLRQSFGYPPYTRIVNILFKHYNPAIVRRAAFGFAEIGRSVFGEHLLGPDQPPVSRIKNLYLQSLMLKIDISTSALASKTCLCQIRDKIHEMADFKAVQIVFDVDPI
jgi:primosomal protein N' (replication factor Y)